MPRVPVPHGTWGVRLRRTSQLLVLPEVSVLQAEPAQTGESSSTQRWATPPRPFLTPRGRSTSVAAYTTPSRRPHGAPAPAVPQAAQGCPGRAGGLSHCRLASPQGLALPRPPPSGSPPGRRQRAPAEPQRCGSGGGLTLGLSGRRAGTPGQCGGWN